LLTDIDRLTSISSFEAAKTAREEARNLLEGYLYRLSGLLDAETDNKSLLEYSTPAEQEALSRLLKESFEWLSDHAEKADKKTLQAKRGALE
jgi:hypoxia up-regulated 1